MAQHRLTPEEESAYADLSRASTRLREAQLRAEYTRSISSEHADRLELIAGTLESRNASGLMGIYGGCWMRNAVEGIKDAARILRGDGPRASPSVKADQSDVAQDSADVVALERVAGKLRVGIDGSLFDEANRLDSIAARIREGL